MLDMPNQQTIAPHSINHLSRSLRTTLLLIFVGVLLSHILYVSLFAGDLPFWDQWDAEADRLLRPWAEGRLHFLTLFEPHNEHRIFFSRVLALSLFALNNGQWDNLVEAYANVILYAVMLTMLCSQLCARSERKWVRVIFPIFTFLVALQPFGWENTLVGFQSQFYFMAIVAIGMIAISAYRTASLSTFFVLLLLSAASLFTMASGVLACTSVTAVIALRYWRDRSSPKYVIAILMSMALITAIGLALIPNLPYHAALRSVGIREHLNAALTSLMWPLQSFNATNWSIKHCLAAALLMWLPSLIWLIRFAKYRRASNSQLFATGLALWVVAQAMAIAHSRGHDMTALASRYMDISAIGLLINIWFAFDLLPLPLKSSFGSLRIYVAVAVFFFVASYGLAIRFKADWLGMLERYHLVVIQTANVRDYVRTKDFSHLNQPFLHIPYPDPKRLRSLLDNPTINAMLPISVRAPLPVIPNMHEEGLYLGGAPAPLLDPAGLNTYGSYSDGAYSATSSRYDSPILHTRFPYIKVSVTTGSTNIQGLRLYMAQAKESAVLEKRVPLDHSLYPNWSDRYIATPVSDFQLKATTTSNANWLAFSAPVESGRLSMYAHRLQDAVRNMFGAAGHTAIPSFRLLDSRAGMSFASPSAKSASTAGDVNSHANCALDIVNDKLVITSASAQLHKPLSMQGWITNSDGQAPGKFDLLLIEGPDVYGVKVASGINRPDVAKVLHSQDAESAGFNINAQSSSVPAGKYRVIIRLVSNGRAEFCDTQRSIIIGNK